MAYAIIAVLAFLLGGVIGFVFGMITAFSADDTDEV